ncbi:MAG: CoA transferase [Spirochaetes bacterium]|nr:CoA transferase [Spirochaetota bacterium]
MQILKGITVIDITQFISGSRCTQILADLGAEVIKVEPPQGDTLRLIFKLMPGAERCYSVLNRNKYGIAVDWRDPRGCDIVRKLASGADILVHNLVPGAMERGGLGYEDIRALKNDIIYAAISGFGATGVEPERSAFDIVAQSVGGQYWNDQDTFLLPDNYWGDLITGAYSAIAVLIALLGRERTGRGQYIDISMQDVMYYNNYRATMDKALEPIMGFVEKELGRNPRDVLNSEDRMPFYGFFKSKDGKVAVVAITPRQWRDLAEVIGRPEMATDPKFSNVIVQVQNHDEAVALIEEWTTAHDSRDIIARLESKKIPCGIAYTSEQVNRDENLAVRGMFRTVTHAQYGDINVPGFPFKFSEYEQEIRMPAPGLGEHSRFILEDRLGYAPAEIDVLLGDGVVL